MTSGLRRHGQALAAVGLAVVLLVLGWEQILPTPWLSTVGAEPNAWWHLGPLAIITAAMLMKATHPGRVLSAGVFAVLLDIGVGGSIGIFLCLTDLLYGFGIRASQRHVRYLAGGLGAAIVAGALAAAAARADAGTVLNIAVFGIAVLITPLWWAAEVRRGYPLGHDRHVREHLELERHAGILRAQEHKRREALAQERQRLARELHDIVSSQVSAIALSSAARLSDSPEASRDREVLGTIRASSVEALDDLRRMVRLLREPVHQVDPGEAGSRSAGARDGEDVLPKTWESIIVGQQLLGLQVQVRGTAPKALSSAVDVQMRRVLQEALTNARKYGDGSCSVSLVERRRSCELQVLSGAAEQQATRLVSDGERDSGVAEGGLRTMRERVEGLKGTFSAGPVEQGWEVHARVPLRRDVGGRGARR